MDIAAIRAELAEVLATVDGLTAYDVITPNPVLPCAHVGPPISINYHTGYGSERQIRFRILLEVPRSDHRVAQRRLDTYLSWPGVPSELEEYAADNWTDLHVVQVGEAQAVAADETAPTLAVDLTVEITT